MKDKSSGLSGIIALIVLIVAFLGIRKVFPGIGTVLLVIGGIILLLIVLLVVLVIVFSREKTDKGNTPQTMDSAKIISQGRANLLELRRLSMRVKNLQVHELSGGICKTVDKILLVLKEQPEDLHKVRQFLNYYLPTLRSILTKYVRLEGSGVPAEEMTKSTISCLENISTAMDKQYNNLFDNDKLDLSVEMEALTLACKRDGLLSDEDFQSQEIGKLL